jgi:hypothetical protein
MNKNLNKEERKELNNLLNNNNFITEINDILNPTTSLYNYGISNLNDLYIPILKVGDKWVLLETPKRMFHKYNECNTSLSVSDNLIHYWFIPATKKFNIVFNTKLIKYLLMELGLLKIIKISELKDYV